MTIHIIPIDRLSPEALTGVIREFISRNGTDYGEREASPDGSFQQVKHKLEKGLAVLIFDDVTETTNIFAADNPLLKQIEPPNEGDPMNERDEQQQRIAAILGAKTVPVSLESLTLYRDYLSRNLDMPCVMTGVEHPAWEEKYIFGYDDETEHEALKKDHPSQTDTYELKRFEDLIDEGLGILVKVKRVTDNKRFILDLALLRAADRASKNHTLLDDYSAWFRSR